MPEPLPEPIIDDIKRLIAGGKNDTAIAGELGVGRTTVRRIRTGKRIGKRKCSRVVVAYKCPGCELRVICRPCRICEARKQKRALLAEVPGRSANRESE